jgi:hypothetical protein
MMKILSLAVIGGVLLATASATPIIYGSAYAGPTGGSTLYTISPTTGVATPIGPIGFERVGAIDFGPNGVLYGLGSRTTDPKVVLLTINTTTGVGTVIGPTLASVGANTPASDMSFRPSDGILFAYISGSIYTIDTSTGKATQIGAPNPAHDGNAIAFSSTNILYLGNQGSLDTIDQATAAESLVIALNYSQFPRNDGILVPRTNAMDFDPQTGTLWASIADGFGPAQGGTLTNYLATIDIGTGTVNKIGTTVTGLDAIAVNSVPEPASLVLTALGAFALVMSRRRRRVSGGSGR